MAYLDTQGTVFARGDGASPEVFTAVGQVTSITSAGQSRALIDVTTLDSTSRQYKLAIKDGQEMTLAIQYDSASTSQTGLRTDMVNGTTRNFRLTLTDSPATTIDFAGLVTNWTQDFEIDGVVSLNVTIKPTGDLTYA